MTLTVTVALTVIAIALFAGVWGDVGVTDEGTASGAQAGTNGWRVHLFVNNYTPLVTSIPANFTEATFGGYSSILMGVGTAGAISVDTVPITWGGAFSWTAAGGGADMVYGYWIEDGTGNFIAGERFAGGPYDMTIAGATLSIGTITESLARV